MARKALGRGLSALIREVEASVPVPVAPSPSEPTGQSEAPRGAGPREGASPQAPSFAPPEAVAGLRQIPISLIDPNPLQPRRHFPEETIEALAASIRSTGLLQPILLRPVPIETGLAAGRFQIVAGERRFEAALRAQLDSLPALIRPLGNQEMLEIALTENLLREDLNAVEIACAYNSLQSDFSLTHEEIAERVGVNRSTVTNTLRLLRLPDAVQEMVREGALSEGHARALLGFDSPALQLRYARTAAAKGLSVRELERLAAAEKAGPAPGSPPAEKPVDANVRAATRELERVLGTRVRITGDGKRGKIEISYFSAEDLNRIYELIRRPEGS